MNKRDNYAISEQQRQFQATGDVAVIKELDWAAKKIRVSGDDANVSDWLDWPAEVGRNYIRWRPLREGQGVVTMALNGDPTQAQIVGMLYGAGITSPSDDPDIDLIQFENGNLIEHSMTTGKFRIVGDIEVEGDVIAKGISLIFHLHDLVKKGSEKSGKPV